MSFYGNIKNNSRSSFIFDRTYPNRVTMEAKANEDGVYNGRYVLVEYGEKKFIDGASGYEYIRVAISQFQKNISYYTYNKNSHEYELQNPLPSRPLEGVTYYVRSEKTGSVIDPNCDYEINRRIDEETYHGFYDSTAWQKIWRSTAEPNYEGLNPDGVDGATVWEKYIMVAELNAQAPKLTLIPDAPSDNDNGEPHFDMQHSTTADYKLHMPRNWKFSVNGLAVGDADFIDWFNGLENQQYNEEDYINDKFVNKFDYNKKGFDFTTRSYIAEPKNRTYLEERISGAEYPTHTENGLSQICETDEASGSHVMKYDQIQEDTKVLGLDIQSIGNAISDIWDLIYSKPVVDDGINRKTYIGLERETPEDELNNRAIYDTTSAETRENTASVAGMMNTFADALGLESDNDYANWIGDDSYERLETIYAVFNAMKTMLGKPDDNLDEVIQYSYIYDTRRAEEMGDEYQRGLISETTYNTYMKYGWPLYTGPDGNGLYIQIKFQTDENGVYLTDENGNYVPSELYDSETLYSTAPFTVWSYLNDLMKSIRDRGHVDFLEDATGSTKHILNRPTIIFNQEPIEGTYYLIENPAIIVTLQEDGTYLGTDGELYELDQLRAKSDIAKYAKEAIEFYNELNGITDDSPDDIKLKSWDIEVLWSAIHPEKDVSAILVEEGMGGSVGVGDVTPLTEFEINDLINQNFIL